MKLNDVFPDWLNGGGIFSAMQGLGVPWESPDIIRALDFEYHGNVSGEKDVSPLVRKLADGKPLPPDKIHFLAQTALDFYGENWHRLFEALQEVYNPIDNYNMVETETGTTMETATDTKTLNLSKGHTATNTDVGKTGGTVTQDGKTTNKTDSGIYGFNSGTSSPSENQTDDGTTKLTTTTTGTDDNTRTESGTDTTTGTDKNEKSGTGTNTRTLTRAGNIGVTTTQQMLESEYSLRKMNYFREVVFPDVDKILTLGIY